MNRIDEIIVKVEKANGIDTVSTSNVILTFDEWETVRELLRSAQSAYKRLADCDMNEAAIQLAEICEDE